MDSSFSKWLNHPTCPVSGLEGTIRLLSIPQRKAILTCCRCQSIPTPDSKLYHQLLAGYPQYEDLDIPTPMDGPSTSLSTIIKSLREYILDPIPNGFLQMLVKVIPLPDEEVLAAIEQSYRKEIVASLERRYTPEINPSSVLSVNAKERNAPLIRTWTTFSPTIHRYIFSRLRRAIPKLTRNAFYPNYGKKLLSTGSRKVLNEMRDILEVACDETTLGLEQLYSRTGMELTGLTEIRHAFTYNDLRPRVYFCRGAEHYYASRFIQDILSAIIEQFECIHKLKRFQISELKCAGDEIFMVYDFTTFTTNLQSLSEFLHGLADLYADTEITIIDTYKGPLRISLQEYIHHYATECNDLPLYELFADLENPLEGVVFESGGGLLGIPGNITASTLWHAIILMCLLQEESCKVVGDDGGCVLPAGDKPENLVDALNLFGDVALEKTEAWSWVDVDEDIEGQVWNYVKRPIYRLEGSIHTGRDPMNFPNPSLFIRRFADKHHRSTEIVDPLASRVRCADRLVRACQRYQISEQGQLSKDICESYHEFILRPVRKEMMLRKKKGGVLSMFHQSIFDDGFEDWYRHLQGNVRLPQCTEGRVYPDVWHTMQPTIATQSKALKLMVDLGYGTSQMIMENVCVDDVDRMRDYYDHVGYPQYLFVIFDSCPLWLLNLLPYATDYPIDEEIPDPTAIPDVDDDYMEIY